MTYNYVATRICKHMYVNITQHTVIITEIFVKWFCYYCNTLDKLMINHIVEIFNNINFVLAKWYIDKPP